LESEIEINKALTIVGNGWPTVDANSEGMIFVVKSSGVSISGINFVNTPVSFVKENSAILIDGVRNCQVTGNTFQNNFFAIYAANSANCRISGNVVKGNAKRVVTAGNGIHLWYCKNMTIENNSVTGQRDGIYFEFVKNSFVTNNFIKNNLRYGLHFMFSDSCTYENNNFIGNSAGVAVMYTRTVEMRHNEFKDSWGGAAYGLLLKDIKDCFIFENRFERNSIAIHIDGSDRVRIEKNVLIDNGWAIKIMANCQENEIVDNDFINNSFQVATNSRNSKSELNGNYWSTYQGYDLDRDGYGDVSYRPVSLYSLLVESNPPTLVLLRSLTIEALDLAERIIPTLTPQTLVDSKPRMRPNL
jgi:nitrous oxidase accessory protein